MAMIAQNLALQHQLNHSTHIKQTKPTNTVIVFDFDDTLFPTAKLNEIISRSNRVKRTHYGYAFKNTQTKLVLQGPESIMTSQERIELTNISHCTYCLLIKYIEQYSKRNICIVSASYPNWVEMALLMVYDIGYYSKIYDLLFDGNNSISIYHPSADQYISWKQSMNLRSHKDISSHPITLWKYEIFKHVFNKKAKISGNSIINIFVIIGDMSFEYEAAQKLNEKIESVYGEKNKNIFIDRVKLCYKPRINTLKQEQIVLTQLCHKRYYQKYSLLNQKKFDFVFNRAKPILDQTPSDY